jgi:predicted RNase H-like nuclease (RuvC/YqgF family)
MLAKELAKLLSYSPDNVVSILIKKPYTTIGGSPVTNIRSISEGFDWDSGKTMLVPESPLWEVDKTQSDQMKTLNDKIGWLEYENRNLKSEITKLKKKLKTYEPE